MVVILVLSEFGAISFELMGWEIAVGGTPLGGTAIKFVLENCFYSDSFSGYLDTATLLKTSF
ncbi:hypothetical protein [Helicobacter pylori]|uniref:hypothetical protein n=1 Tax=Helicobacter pylori TaxID=210 RepID=UPI0018D11298|nr:hypothetical protein [Helicobacter pylori]MBH0307108.1 hypothetical protein [Helicobacter pylori]